MQVTRTVKNILSYIIVKSVQAKAVTLIKCAQQGNVKRMN